MKKSILFATLLLMLSTLLCSCQKDTPYEERLQGRWVSDSREIMSFIEFNGASYNFYLQKDRSRTIVQSNGTIDASEDEFYLLESKSFAIESSYAVMLDGAYWGVVSAIGSEYFDLSDHNGNTTRYLKLKKFAR